MYRFRVLERMVQGYDSAYAIANATPKIYLRTVQDILEDFEATGLIKREPEARGKKKIILTEHGKKAYEMMREIISNREVGELGRILFDAGKLVEKYGWEIVWRARKAGLLREKELFKLYVDYKQRVSDSEPGLKELAVGAGVVGLLIGTAFTLPILIGKWLCKDSYE